MKFYSIFAVYGLTFICVKFFDISLASIDHFDLLTFIPGDVGANCSSPFPLTSSAVFINWIFFSLSLLVTLIFILFFCTCSCVCLCIDEYECGHNLNMTTLKVLVEISIYAVLFNPNTQVNLLLRNCLFGYICVAVSFILYSLAIVVFLAMFDRTVKRQSSHPSHKCREIVLICLMVPLQSVQLATTVFAITVSYSFPNTLDFTNIRYSFVALVGLFFFSVLVKGIGNRLSLYSYLSKRRDHFFCERCCIDAVATFVGIFSAVFMIISIYKYYWNTNTTRSTLFDITLILLLLSITFSVVLSFYNYYFSLADSPNTDGSLYIKEDDGEELMSIEDEDDDNNGNTHYLKIDTVEDDDTL